ncbi:MAG: FtsQ-type POTRA domain-containing protein [Acidobacteriales bacterium]|nr:FtsQ-type POTRA domain-containing protein [Terriglobales bacterium]
MARIENRFSPEPPARAPRERAELASPVTEDLDPALDELRDDEDEEDPQFLRASRRVPVRKGPVTRKTARRLRWVFLGILAFGVSSGAAFALYQYGTHSWRFRIESGDRIESLGHSRVTRAQIMDVMGADIGRNIFKVPLDERKRQLEEIPWVETASVMRLLPDRLRVQITERTPLAFVRIGSRVALIDAGGVVMDLPSRQRSEYSFPVITGMAEAEPLSTRAARMRIYQRLAQELDSNDLGYSKDLSEVDLSDPDDVKITVEDAGGALLIHMGSADFLDRYRIYMRHIQEWRQQFAKLESVDLRFNGQIIVNPDTRNQVTSKIEDTRGKSKP